MNSKSQIEINWWKHLKDTIGRDEFVKVRQADWEDYNSHLGIDQAEGVGLDYGCGPLSILEFSGKEYDGFDPLAEEYRALSGATLFSSVPDKKYDWVLCANVLDHDPNPEAIIQDIHDHLVDGGILFFEVHFDDRLGNPHYQIFDEQKIEELMRGRFKLAKKEIVRYDETHQSKYWAVYKKENK